MLESIQKFFESTGIYQLFGTQTPLEIGKYLVMYVIIGALFYLALVKKFEPLLLVSIAFGMLLANLPGAISTNVFHMDFFIASETVARTALDMAMGVITSETPVTAEIELTKWFIDAEINPLNWITKLDVDAATGAITAFEIDPSKLSLVDSVKMTFLHGGLVDYLYLGVKTGIYPSLIFLGIGAMTDFTALIANPKSLLLGAAAQLGVFVAFLGSILLGFDLLESAAIGIIGGADGPTAILVTKTLAPHLLGAIAIAAYSYMALIPIIQPPFMKLLTTKKERVIEMQTLRPVSQIEKVLFPIIVTFIVCLIVPDAAPLVGFLMLGNLFTVCGVTDRLSKTAQNELINIVTIMLGVSVGATANAMNFLALDTIKIIVLGLTAFCISTCGGLLFGKLMCFMTKGKINPLIGSAGVSAVPMAARVSQIEGQKVNPKNFLLMHAMGPNVAGVIGSAVAAGVLLSCFG